MVAAGGTVDANHLVPGNAYCRTLAVIYGVLGIFYVPAVVLRGAQQVTLPVGIIAPLVYLNLNLHLPAPRHFLTGILSTLAACLCYTSGWLTGAAAVVAFNFIAKRPGGVEASILTSTLSAGDHSAVANSV